MTDDVIRDDKSNNTFFIFLAILVVVGIIIWLGMQKKEEPGQVVIPSGWVATTTMGVTFRYPETLDTKYVSLVVWPPQVQVIKGDFPCVASTSTVETTTAPQKRIINNREYCVVVMNEGAAGSTYRQHVYAFKLKNSTSTATLAFTLRYPQCLNYNDPERTACQTEQDAFSIDKTIDQIAQTVTQL
jgi:hypothetical protein